MMGAPEAAAGRTPTVSRSNVPAWIVRVAAALYLVVPDTALAQPERLAPPPPPAEVGPSGLTLMVVAYSAIWLVAFAFVVVTLRRQGRLDARVDRLESLLTDRARGTGPSSGADREARDAEATPSGARDE